MADSNCRGRTEEMFPKEPRDQAYIRGARAICKKCPVVEQCREYALQFPHQDMHGVWAFMTSRQLEREQKRLGIGPTRSTIAGIWGDGR